MNIIRKNNIKKFYLFFIIYILEKTNLLKKILRKILKDIIPIYIGEGCKYN